MMDNTDDSWGPPLSKDEVEKFKKFFARPRERLAVIVDDLEADAHVGTEHRKKVLESFDELGDAFDVKRGSMVVFDGPAAEPITKTVLSLFCCGPSTSPCGPNHEDHQWDAEVEFTDDSGRVTGGSVACSRCGLTAMDFDRWSAP